MKWPITYNIVKFSKPIVSVYKFIKSFIINKTANHFTILVYHSISCHRKLKSSRHYTIDPLLFDIHMNYLNNNNFKVINLAKFHEIMKTDIVIDRKFVVLTFDDGYADSYFYAYPILKKYDFNATFFLITSLVGTKTTFPWLHELLFPRGENLPLFPDQIVEMDKEGMDFGAHTHLHQRLIQLSPQQAFEEIQRSKSYIEDLLGREINSFSYPYGSWSDFDRSHQEMVKKAGYELAVTSIYGSNSRNSNPFLLRRIQIYGNDDLNTFKMKISGFYDWIGNVQKVLSLFTHHLRLR